MVWHRSQYLMFYRYSVSIFCVCAIKNIVSCYHYTNTSRIIVFRLWFSSVHGVGGEFFFMLYYMNDLMWLFYFSTAVSFFTFLLQESESRIKLSRNGWAAHSNMMRAPFGCRCQLFPNHYFPMNISRTACVKLNLIR